MIVEFAPQRVGEGATICPIMQARVRIDLDPAESPLFAAQACL